MIDTLKYLEPIIISGIKRSPLLIHYGSKTYCPEKLLPVKNGDWVKPKHGGLWTSPIDSEWGWKEWCRNEDFRECEEFNSFTVCLKQKSKILVINSLEDLKNAPLVDGYSKKVLDFESISDYYDAIWLTEKGQEDTHLTYPNNLYGWDCESVLIMNSNCIIHEKTN